MTEAAAARHMDGIYRHQRHIYNLTRKYYLLGRDRLLEDLRPPPGGAILEIACGTGRNLILAARRYPAAPCFGFDVSAAMLETARRSVDRAGLASRIALAQGDATAFDAGALFVRDKFERVVISYALSMIPGWREALHRAAEALAPGGRLHVVDFGQQDRWPRLFRKALFAWLARFDVHPRADLEDALKQLAIARDLNLTFEPLHGGYAWYAVLQAPPFSCQPSCSVGACEV